MISAGGPKLPARTPPGDSDGVSAAVPSGAAVSGVSGASVAGAAVSLGAGSDVDGDSVTGGSLGGVLVGASDVRGRSSRVVGVVGRADEHPDGEGEHDGDRRRDGDEHDVLPLHDRPPSAARPCPPMLPIARSSWLSAMWSFALMSRRENQRR